MWLNSVDYGFVGNSNINHSYLIEFHTKGMCTHTTLLCYSSRLAMWTGWRGTGIVSMLLLVAFFLISFPFVFDGEALQWYLVRFTAKHKCSCDHL